MKTIGGVATLLCMAASALAQQPPLHAPSGCVGQPECAIPPSLAQAIKNGFSVSQWQIDHYQETYLCMRSEAKEDQQYRLICPNTNYRGPTTIMVDTSVHKALKANPIYADIENAPPLGSYKVSGQLQRLLHDSDVNVGTDAMGGLISQGAKNMGADRGGAAELGRMAARASGVGRWTSHFNNQTDEWWAVAMIGSGACHLDNTPGPNGQGDHFSCMIPPHMSASLDFRNDGSQRTRIAIASENGYRLTYDLPIVGCHIQYDAPQPLVHLNYPSTCDITADRKARVP